MKKTIREFVDELYNLKHTGTPGKTTRNLLLKYGASFNEQQNGSQEFPDFSDVCISFFEGNIMFSIEEKSSKTSNTPMFNSHIPSKKDDCLFLFITLKFSVPFLGEHICNSKQYESFMECQEEKKKISQSYNLQLGFLKDYCRLAVKVTGDSFQKRFDNTKTRNDVTKFLYDHII